MYKQWTNPPLDITDGASLRAWVLDMHTQITATGTGVTHLSDIPGQFDFTTEVLSKHSSNYMIGSARSKPLYYKYESDGNNTLFIKIYFCWHQYSTHVHPRINTKSGVWTTEDDMINEMHYVDEYTRLVAPMKYSSSPNSYDGVVEQVSGDSYLINNDGTLFIAIHAGDIRGIDAPHRVTRAAFFLCVEALPNGFNQLRHYNESRESTDTIGSSGGSSVTSSQRYAVLTTVVDKQFAIEKYPHETNIMQSSSASPSLIQICSYDINSNIRFFSKMFYYNRSIVGGNKLTTIDGRKVFMAGSAIDEVGLTVENYTFAILAE